MATKRWGYFAIPFDKLREPDRTIALRRLPGGKLNVSVHFKRTLFTYEASADGKIVTSRRKDRLRAWPLVAGSHLIPRALHAWTQFVVSPQPGQRCRWHHPRGSATLIPSSERMGKCTHTDAGVFKYRACSKVCSRGSLPTTYCSYEERSSK